MGNSGWWTRGFPLRAQGGLQEIYESLETTGQILSVFTLTFFLRVVMVEVSLGLKIQCVLELSGNCLLKMLLLAPEILR